MPGWLAWFKVSKSLTAHMQQLDQGPIIILTELKNAAFLLTFRGVMCLVISTPLMNGLIVLFIRIIMSIKRNKNTERHHLLFYCEGCIRKFEIIL